MMERGSAMSKGKGEGQNRARGKKLADVINFSDAVAQKKRDNLRLIPGGRSNSQPSKLVA